MTSRVVKTLFPSLLVFAVSLGAATLLPRAASSLFTGPDGTRWVAPFIVWMGCVCALYCACMPHIGRHCGGREAVWLGGVIAVLGGMMLFVAGQRLTSGLRELEAFHEAGCIRLATGIGLYNDIEKGPMGTYYAPLLYIAGGLIYRIFPGIPGCGRIISIMSVIITAVFVYRIAADRVHTRIAGLWATAFFLATYAVTWKMYDWGLTDPLMMCILAVSLFFLLKNTTTGDMLSLWFAGLACLAKQTALIPFLAVFWCIITARRPLRAYAPLLFWVIIGASIILYTNGRAWAYLVASPAGFSFRRLPDPGALLPVFVLQLPLWILAGAQWRKSTTLRFELFAASIFSAFILGIWKHGGWINAVFPFEPILCIAAAGVTGKWRLLGIIQLIAGLYNPFSTLYPWTTIRDTDRRAVEMAQQTGGDVWFPAQPYLYNKAGKPFWEDFASLEMCAGLRCEVPPRLLNALRTKRFTLVVMRNGGDFWLKSIPAHVTQLLYKNYDRTASGELIIFMPKPDE